MKYLIVNADDFGLNSDVNKGIIMAREAGAITNATLMVKREGAREAIDYALANPSFSVGLHIDIDKIVLGERVGSKRFEKSYLRERLDDLQLLNCIEEEIQLQADLFEKSGLMLTHIDSHHHLHALPQVFNIILKVFKGRRISTMRAARDFDLVKYPSILWNDAFYESATESLKRMNIITADHFLPFSKVNRLNTLTEGVTELMTHPGKGEPWREEELDFLLSTRWKEMLNQNNVKLISFRDLTTITSVERN